MRATPNLRKAITLAINRQAICDTVFEGTRVPADNIVPPGIAGYEKGAWADAKYDVEARQGSARRSRLPGAARASRRSRCPSTAAAVTRRSWSSSRPTSQGHRHQRPRSHSADFPLYLKQLRRRQVPDRSSRLGR